MENSIHKIKISPKGINIATKILFFERINEHQFIALQYSDDLTLIDTIDIETKLDSFEVFKDDLSKITSVFDIDCKIKVTSKGILVEDKYSKIKIPLLDKSDLPDVSFDKDYNKGTFEELDSSFITTYDRVRKFASDPKKEEKLKKEKG